MPVNNRLLAYFMTIGLSDHEAHALHIEYYTQYGLAVRGLARHHHIGELFVPSFQKGIALSHA